MSEINFDYTHLHPFKWFILENFPFLEDSIDGLTNYQMLCKLGEEINKNRNAINEIGENEEDVVNAFNALQTYVQNYFNNLDVQDEINEKLDELVEDGTLTELIGAYCQPRIDAQNTLINNLDNKIDEVADYQNAQINEIENKVDAVSSGSPAGVYATVAALTAANPDHSKIYLVTADGKWYYYNSSSTSWTAGGTYQSTSLVLDKSLDVSGQAPDSQTVGGRIKIIDSIYTTRLDPNLFENGGLNAQNGSNTNTQYRFRSKTMLYSNNDIVITVPVGIQIGFITYTSAGTFVSWSDFRTQNTIRWQILIPKNTYFRIMCQRVNPDTTEVINFVNIVNDMRVLINKTQNEKDIYDYVNNRLNTADFINGNISGNSVVDTTIYRIISKYVFSYPVQTSIKVPLGYQIGYNVYNSSTFDQQSWSGWTTGPDTLQVPANTSIRLLIKKVNEDTSQTLNVNTVIPLFNCHPTTTDNVFNNLSGTLRSYGATKFVIAGSSTVHRSVNNNYTMIITFSNNIGFVFLPTSVANESFKRVTMTHTTFTLDNNKLLVYNISSNDVEVITQSAFISNIDNYILICWNHYGEIKGQLLDEYLSSIRNVSFETNTVEITCRQGEIDGYPENTLQAFKRAKEFGYNHIRLSFGWTSDGVAICSHFDQVSSSTLRNLDGTEIVDDTILLSNLTYEYIEENYDAGIYKGSKFAGIEVPTVAEVLIQAKKLNQKVDLEYKFGYTEQRLESLLEYIYTIGMEDVCLITSDYTSVINATKASTNKLDVALIGHLNQTSVTNAISLGVNRLDIFIGDTYDSDLVLQLHQNNIKVKLGSSYNYADSVTYIEYYDVVECANQINPILIING